MHVARRWHLNALPPLRRLRGLALRLSIDDYLARGCAAARGGGPRMVVHDDFGLNNDFAEVPGLAELLARHNGTWPSDCKYKRRCSSAARRWRSVPDP